VKIAIVNDLAVACEALRRAIAADPALSVAWIARDGDEAVVQAQRSKPDLILMDLIMPRVNGVEATRQIMRVAPCPILVVTATVSGNAGLVYEALGAGALDAVNTPTFGPGASVQGSDDLLRRIHLIGKRSGVSMAAKVAAPAVAPIAPRVVTAQPQPFVTPSNAPSITPSIPRTASVPPPIIAIGASTGGPRAIADVLRAMPQDLPAAVVIVQHVSVDFVRGFAEWLAVETKRRVELSRPGYEPRAGDVIIAGEDRHMTLCTNGRIEHREEPSTQLHRPAVDEMFASLAANARPGVAVLLTGMGRDGAEGLLKLRRAGWHTIAQDEGTSVVWGMPGAAHALGAAVETLPLSAIGAAVAARIKR